ncbi:hypothetical protein ACFMJ4_16135, partial [Acinetobacter baumannii]
MPIFSYHSALFKLSNVHVTAGAEVAVDAASTVKAQAQTQITAQEQNDLNRASTTLQNLQKAEDQNADSGIAASTPVATAKTTTAT